MKVIIDPVLLREINNAIAELCSIDYPEDGHESGLLNHPDTYRYLEPFEIGIIEENTGFLGEHLLNGPVSEEIRQAVLEKGHGIEEIANEDGYTTILTIKLNKMQDGTDEPVFVNIRPYRPS